MLCEEVQERRDGNVKGVGSICADGLFDLLVSRQAFGLLELFQRRCRVGWVWQASKGGLVDER